MKLEQIFDKYPTEQEYIDFLVKNRWGEDFLCPKCEFGKVYRKKDKPPRKERLQCKKCNYTFFVGCNSIFHKTYIDMRHWAYLYSIFTSEEVLPKIKKLPLGARNKDILDAAGKTRVGLCEELGVSTSAVKSMTSKLFGLIKEPEKHQDHSWFVLDVV